MNILTKDLIPNAIVYNKSSFYVYPGHSVDFILDSRAGKQGWFSGSSTIKASTYGPPMYGEQLYGSMIVRADYVRIEIDLQTQGTFDTFGITNTNIEGGVLDISYGDTPQAQDGTVQFNMAAGLQTRYYKLSDEALTYRYIAIEFTNSVSQGILKIGNIGLGLEYELPAIAPTYDTALNSSAYRSLTTTRQVYGGPNVQWRTLSFSTAPQVTKDGLFNMFKAIDVYKPTYWQFSEPCLIEDPLYGILSAFEIDQFNDQARMYSGRFSMEEVY